MTSAGIKFEPITAMKHEFSSMACGYGSLSDTSPPALLESSDESGAENLECTGTHTDFESLFVPAGKLEDKEQTKVQLAAKNREIQISKRFLRKFQSWLNERGDGKGNELSNRVPEKIDWNNAIDDILQRGTLPRVVLGFMGPSGSGKSSAINALLNEEELVPTNGSEACTAVAVEISWNESDDPAKAYIAKIQFASHREWKHDLDLIVDELRNLGPDDLLKPEGDAKVALDKFKAVYPDMPIEELNKASAALLMTAKNISSILGTEKVITEAAGNARNFAAQISAYIDSSLKANSNGRNSRENPPYWPLVKVVKIYTRSRVLKTGLVLVDLPGLGDYNRAREMVTETYMHEVSAICIVANIGRALSNSIARDLFGRGKQLKRRLLRGGLLDDEHTFFVLSHTDVITIKDVVNGQGWRDCETELQSLYEARDAMSKRQQSISEKKSELEKRTQKRLPMIKKLKERITTLQATNVSSGLGTNKRRRLEDERDFTEANETNSLEILEAQLDSKLKGQEKCDSDLKALERQGISIKGQLEEMYQPLHVGCIKKRNDYVIHRMAMDFTIGRHEAEEELNVRGGPTASFSLDSSSSVLRNGVHTFTVCSKAYQIFNRRLGEKMPAGFDKIEDTLIPQLMSHCEDFTSGAQDQVADDACKNTNQLRSRITNWCENTVPDTQTTKWQNDMLQDQFKAPMEDFEQIISQSINLTIDKLRQHVDDKIHKATDIATLVATEKAAEIFNGWTHRVENAQTWKAICRKGGNHTSKPKANDRTQNMPFFHRWNDDLAAALTELLDNDMRNYVEEVLPEILGAHTSEFTNAVGKFRASLKTSCLSITENIANTLEHFLQTMQRKENVLFRDMSLIFTKFIRESRRWDGGVLPQIGVDMKPGYDKALNPPGSPFFAASKRVLQSHIRSVSKTMYPNAGKGIHKFLDDRITELENYLKKPFRKHLDDTKDGFAKMLKRAHKIPIPDSGPYKAAFQKEALVWMKEWDALLNGHSLETDVAVGSENYFDGKLEEEEDLESGNQNHHEDIMDHDPITFDLETFSDED